MLKGELSTVQNQKSPTWINYFIIVKNNYAIILTLSCQFSLMESRVFLFAIVFDKKELIKQSSSSAPSSIPKDRHSNNRYVSTNCQNFRWCDRSCKLPLTVLGNASPSASLSASASASTLIGNSLWARGD